MRGLGHLAGVGVGPAGVVGHVGEYVAGVDHGGAGEYFAEGEGRVF